MEKCTLFDSRMGMDIYLRVIRVFSDMAIIHVEWSKMWYFSCMSTQTANFMKISHVLQEEILWQESVTAN